MPVTLNDVLAKISFNSYSTTDQASLESVITTLYNGSVKPPRLGPVCKLGFSASAQGLLAHGV